MIEIDDSTSPEQTAADLIRAAFNALSRIQARDDADQHKLAVMQGDLSQAFVDLSEIRSIA